MMYKNYIINFNVGRDLEFKNIQVILWNDVYISLKYMEDRFVSFCNSAFKINL